MAKRHCHGTTKRDKPCQAAALRDSDYCSAHDPDSPGSARFGSREQAAAAGARGGRPRVPRVSEVMREWVEEHAEEILDPYVTALIDDDVEVRMKAAERLQDRVLGRPSQRVEHTGARGENVTVDFTLDPKAREAIAGALRGRPASR